MHQCSDPNPFRLKILVFERNLDFLPLLLGFIALPNSVITPPPQQQQQQQIYSENNNVSGSSPASPRSHASSASPSQKSQKKYLSSAGKGSLFLSEEERDIFIAKVKIAALRFLTKFISLCSEEGISEAETSSSPQKRDRLSFEEFAP